MRANRLHMEAALLSNTLHQYRDDDIDGARSVIAQIDEKRRQWQQVKNTIAYFDKTGKLPEERAEQSILTPIENQPGVAEARVELSRLNVNISKYQKKIETQPDHKKVEQWKEDLAKMEHLKREIKQQIVNLTYATKQ